MKKLFIAFGLMGFIATSVAAQSLFQKSKDIFFVSPDIVEDTGTTTIKVPKFKIETHTPSLEKQGWCDAYKDSDGIGYTYVWHNDGQEFINSTGCE